MSVRLFDVMTSSNPVDLGWWAVRTRLSCVDGWELLGVSRLLAWEVTVKVYGVAVTMPQG